ncbi:MAG: 4-hydroxythreonine-4-phosphate dehydrogenase PdxA [Myxococcota bacterium]
MGDGAGIGPEILLALMRQSDPRRSGVIYGSARVMQLTAHHFAHPLPLHTISLAQWQQQPILPQDPEQVTIIDVTAQLPHAAQEELATFDAIPFGEPRTAFGHLQRAALVAAIDDALAGRIAGICTAPLNKALFAHADLPVTGHTEILAERTQTPEAVMMLAGDRLRVSLVTTHLPLQAVSEHLTTDGILNTLQVTHSDLKRRWNMAQPRIAVAALNPHAGEQGNMGHEEREVIVPAIEAAQQAGIRAEGPFPADTLFARLRRDWPFDAVVCMYHDQGLIPLKLTHFGASANITLGLPIVRTSVDHGTAYDIAGQGVADADSMRYAFGLALRLSQGG